jgi:type VI secretion system protein
MPKGHTLLERFRKPDLDEELVATENIGALVDSVIQHLTKMLNTPQNIGTLIQPDYGMIALSDIHSLPDPIANVQKSIRTTIEKYEPRLRDVRVEHEASEEDPMNLKFKITARLVLRKGRELVYFETLVKPSGQVQVNG